MERERRGDGVSTTRVSEWIKYRNAPVDQATHLLTPVVLTSLLKMRVPFSYAIVTAA